MKITIKILLTALLMTWASAPYFEPSGQNTQVEMLNSMPKITIFLIIICFLGFVAIYCNDLQKCLSLIAVENRKASPTSVWFMFLMPFNFVEDFFIVINLSNSIEAEAMGNSKLANLKDYGMTIGIGWCIAQILSFIPNTIGLAAGLLGLILVIFHWLFIRKINRLLA